MTKCGMLWSLLSVCAILAGCNLDPLPSVPGTPVWSMRDGNPARTRHVADMPLEKPPKLLWKRRFLEQKDPEHLIAAVVADRETLCLICRIDEWVHLQPGEHERMYAIGVRLADGKELWRYQGPDLRGKGKYAGSLQEGKLFLVTEKGLLVLDSRTGGLLRHLKKDWKDDRRYPVCAMVEAPKNRLYVSGRKGQVRCLSLTDGEQLWSTRVFAGLTDVDDLTVHEDRLIVVGGGEENGIAALDAADGRVLWRKSRAPWLDDPFERGLDDPPSVAGGKVLIPGGLRLMPPVYCLMALNVNTGRVVWKRKHVHSGASGDGGRVYAKGTTTDGYYLDAICCLDARSGRRLWAERVDSPLARPIVSGNTLLLACEYEGPPALPGGDRVPERLPRKGWLLRGISANDGESLWTVRVLGISDLAVTGKYIVVVSKDCRSVWVFTPSEGALKRASRVPKG